MSGSVYEAGAKGCTGGILSGVISPVCDWQAGVVKSDNRGN